MCEPVPGGSYLGLKEAATQQYIRLAWAAEQKCSTAALEISLLWDCSVSSENRQSIPDMKCSILDGFSEQQGEQWIFFLNEFLY